MHDDTDLGPWYKLYWRAKSSFALQCSIRSAIFHAVLHRAAPEDNPLTGRKRGEAIISLRKMADATEGVSYRRHRNALDELVKLGTLEIVKAGRSGTIVKLCNFATYQDDFAESGTQRDKAGHSGTKRDTAGRKKKTIEAIEAIESKEENARAANAASLRSTAAEKRAVVITENAARLSPKLAEAYLAFAEYRGAKLKPQSLKTLASRMLNVAAERGDEAVADAVDRAIANGWAGWDHFDKQQRSNGAAFAHGKNIEYANQFLNATHGDEDDEAI